jgi:hypothetical protein
MKIGLGRCLTDPGLIRTERITALEDERDALERRSRPHLLARCLTLVRAAEVGPERPSRVGNRWWGPRRPPAPGVNRLDPR